MRAAVERESARLEGRGRVLLRPSGTEPVVRVMVEAPTAEEADAVCARLVDAARSGHGLNAHARLYVRCIGGAASRL